MDERTCHKPVHASILHAVSPVDAAEMEKELRKRFELKEFYMTEIGPVIGVHSGPNAVGIAFYAD